MFFSERKCLFLVDRMQLFKHRNFFKMPDTHTHTHTHTHFFNSRKITAPSVVVLTLVISDHGRVLQLYGGEKPMDQVVKLLQRQIWEEWLCGQKTIPQAIWKRNNEEVSGKSKYVLLRFLSSCFLCDVSSCNQIVFEVKLWWSPLVSHLTGYKEWNLSWLNLVHKTDA